MNHFFLAMVVLIGGLLSTSIRLIHERHSFRGSLEHPLFKSLV